MALEQGGMSSKSGDDNTREMGGGMGGREERGDIYSQRQGMSLELRVMSDWGWTGWGDGWMNG